MCGILNDDKVTIPQVIHILKRQTHTECGYLSKRERYLSCRISSTGIVSESVKQTRDFIKMIFSRQICQERQKHELLK